MFRRYPHPPFIPTSRLSGGATWPFYDSAYFNSATPLVEPGAYWELSGPEEAGGGNSFLYVKATAALVVGQGAGYAAPVATTVNSTGSSTKKIVTAKTDWTAGALKGGWVSIQNTTSSGGGTVMRRIRDNGTNWIEFAGQDYTVPSSPDDADHLVLAATNTDIVTVWLPNQTIVSTAAVQPIGLALGTVTQNYYTILHVSGVGQALIDGGTVDTAIGVPLVPAAAGTFTGSAAGVANLTMGGGRMIATETYAAATVKLSMVHFNLFPNI